MSRIWFVILFLLYFPCPSLSAVYFSDDFEISQDTWDGRTDSMSVIDSETGYSWSTVWPTQTTTRHAEISASYGHTGKGLRFFLDSSGGTTQESCMFSGGSGWSATSLFWGFWFKVDPVFTGFMPLKMTRFYSGENSVIPEFIGNQWSFFYDAENHYVDTANFELNDTNWHSYVFEFQRGNNVSDGVIRMWVDDTLVYEDLAVDWGDTGTTFTYNLFPMIQGNMSGSYSGGVMSTTWDDFIFASTKSEILSFIGTTETLFSYKISGAMH